MTAKKSNGIETSPARKGQEIVRSFPRDNSSYDPGSKSEQRNGNLKGSDTNLSHSITGSGGVPSIQSGSK